MEVRRVISNPGGDGMYSGGAMKKGNGIWFWIIIGFIFVLYCLAWRRPFCQTLDAAPFGQSTGQVHVTSTR